MGRGGEGWGMWGKEGEGERLKRKADFFLNGLIFCKKISILLKCLSILASNA